MFIFLTFRLVPGAEVVATPSLRDIADHYYTREVEFIEVCQLNISLLIMIYIPICLESRHRS